MSIDELIIRYHSLQSFPAEIGIELDYEVYKSLNKFDSRLCGNDRLYRKPYFTDRLYKNVYLTDFAVEDIEQAFSQSLHVNLCQELKSYLRLPGSRSGLSSQPAAVIPLSGEHAYESQEYPSDDIDDVMIPAIDC
jgi:hypothetical protein